MYFDTCCFVRKGSGPFEKVGGGLVKVWRGLGKFGESLVEVLRRVVLRVVGESSGRAWRCKFQSVTTRIT